MPAPALESFTCRQCGACCRWPGSVLLNGEEVADLAAHLGLPPAQFIERHTTLARNRAQLTLREQAGGACEFLDAAGHCRVYPARPGQCRDFPAAWRVAGCPALARTEPETHPE